jgi:acetyl-CoA C-acetyltransferase
MAEAYIVDAVRTAGGRRGGRLKDWHPADLGGFVVDALLERTQADPQLIEDLIFGCVTQAGEQAFNIARAVGLSSKLPESTPGTTIDRQCGSSQQAVHFAAQAVMSGAADIVIAGGVESMTRVPMGLAASLPAKNGLGRPYGIRVAKRYDNAEFGQFKGAEMMARKYGLSKDVMDAYAYESHGKAARAIQAGLFKQEIVPVPVTGENGVQEWHGTDEGVRADASLEAIRNVKLLQEGGLITAATSSQICDGASAALVANERGLKRLGRAPLGRIHHMSVLGHDPVIMLEAPIPATRRALDRCGLELNDIALYEVNEAFASVPLAWLQALEADPTRLNVHGGAIALGHPLGASGGRLVATLLHALKARGQRYGLQTMCEGGGMANVTVFERL